MTILGGAGVLPSVQPVSEIVIASVSVKELAEAFRPLLQSSVFEKYFLPVAGVAAAIFAAIAAWLSWQISKNSFTNEILKLFFDIQIALPRGKNSSLSDHNKQLLCNYFEFVCQLVKEGRLKEKDVVPLLGEPMKQKNLVNFTKSYRYKYGNRFFSAYWQWYETTK